MQRAPPACAESHRLQWVQGSAGLDLSEDQGLSHCELSGESLEVGSVGGSFVTKSCPVFVGK